MSSSSDWIAQNTYTNSRESSLTSNRWSGQCKKTFLNQYRGKMRCTYMCTIRQINQWHVLQEDENKLYRTGHSVFSVILSVMKEKYIHIYMYNTLLVSIHESVKIKYSLDILYEMSRISIYLKVETLLPVGSESLTWSRCSQGAIFRENLPKHRKWTQTKTRWWQQALIQVMLCYIFPSIHPFIICTAFSLKGKGAGANLVRWRTALPGRQRIPGPTSTIDSHNNTYG